MERSAGVCSERDSGRVRRMRCVASAQTDQRAAPRTLGSRPGPADNGQIDTDTSIAFGPLPQGRIGRITRRLTCAVPRRHSSAGANPARPLPLQPVALGAAEGGNEGAPPRLPARLPHPDGRAGRGAAGGVAPPRRGLVHCSGRQGEAEWPNQRRGSSRGGSAATGAPILLAEPRVEAALEGMCRIAFLKNGTVRKPGKRRALNRLRSGWTAGAPRRGEAR